VASNSPEALQRRGGPTAATAPGPASAGLLRVRVWDLPLRLFHWLLVACLIGSFVTGKVGGSWSDWHFRFGYTALALIVFRLLWGLVGPRYARFTSFVFSPSATVAYLRNAAHAPRTLGHSPLGALSVVALIVAVGVQAGAGLFTSDDIASEGPLARLVSNAFVERASWLHNLNELVLLGLVALHLAAILYYRVFRRESLVKPMVVGDKLIAPDAQHPDAADLASRDDPAVWLRALVVALVASAIVAGIVNWPVF
jgi:cytochrome b